MTETPHKYRLLTRSDMDGLVCAVLLRELSPFWIAAGRLAIGALASWAFLVALRNPFQPTPCSI